MNGIKIVRSGISVYEVEVDLGKYASVTTAQLVGFKTRLLRTLPSLRQHECYAGEVGGFAEELTRGTDLAHVMEHVTLELLKLASGSGRRFTGWTRKKSKNHVIHFQAPDARAAREATAGAVQVIQAVLDRRPIDARALVKAVRRSGNGAAVGAAAGAAKAGR
jgi:cyanophycin synthetase